MACKTNIVLKSNVISTINTIHMMDKVGKSFIISCCFMCFTALFMGSCNQNKKEDAKVNLPIDPVTGVDNPSLYTHKLSDETVKAIAQLEQDSMIEGNLGNQFVRFIKEGVYDYGQVFKFIDLKWNGNTAEPNPKFRAEIDELAKVMILFPALRIKMECYTDNNGKPEVLEKLSQARVDYIKKEIVNTGVNPERINVKGFGSKYPVADNKTMEGQLINNRIEITILKLFN